MVAFSDSCMNFAYRRAMKPMSSLVCRKLRRFGCAVCLALPCPALAANEKVIGSARTFLEHQVQNYLQQNQLDGRWQIEFSPLPAPLALKSCTKSLRASLEGRTPIGRLSVRVHCTEPAWTLLLPARVSLWQRVLAARHPLKRGQKVNEADLTWVERDMGVLGHGGLTELSQVQNQQLTRSIGAGQVLLNSHLKAAQLIAVGEQVEILSQGAGIRVRMKGEALSSGSFGQQIRVRNLSSGRVLHAQVLAPGLVEP